MEGLDKHFVPLKKEPSNLNKSWRFNATMDDTHREMKRVYARKEAIRLAQKVDRSAINDILLKERTEFDVKPKYLSVTRRLYRPEAELQKTMDAKF